MKKILHKMFYLSFSRKRESNQEKTIDYPVKPDNDKTYSPTDPGNKMKKNILVTAISFGVMFFLFASNAYAIGISVKPSELKIQAQIGMQSSVRIKVKNPSQEVALFEVYPEEFENQISASPAKFTLESGEEKDALIKFKSGEEGVFRTYLAVVSRPLDDPEGIGSGAKVALQIENKPRALGLALISDIISAEGVAIIATILAGLGILMLILRKRTGEKQG